MTPVEFVLLGLACWRWTMLVTSDEITAPLRGRISEWATQPAPHVRRLAVDLGMAARRKDDFTGWRGQIQYLVGCPYCASCWLAVPLVLAAVRGPPWLWWAVVVAPAVAAVAALLALVLPEP